MKKFFKGLMIWSVVFLVLWCLIGFSSRPNLYENMVNASVVLYNQYGGGSGVFIDDDVVLTAAHILREGKSFTIELRDGTKFQSKDFYIDEKEDIGFVFVKVKELHIAKVSSESPNIGDTIYFVGAPFNKFFAFSLQKGIVSHTDRDISEWDWEDLLQADIDGGPGASGGPLYNFEGKLVGMYVGHAMNGGVGISLCESAKSILDAYQRCKDAKN